MKNLPNQGLFAFLKEKRPLALTSIVLSPSAWG
jgi:hypothetical protein